MTAPQIIGRIAPPVFLLPPGDTRQPVLLRCGGLLPGFHLATLSGPASPILPPRIPRANRRSSPALLLAFLRADDSAVMDFAAQEFSFCKPPQTNMVLVARSCGAPHGSGARALPSARVSPFFGHLLFFSALQNG